MKQLIVAATVPEIMPFMEKFSILPAKFMVSEKFDVLITGAGMVATAFAMGQLERYPYSLALNVGVAGSFDSNIPLGSVVAVQADSLAELGAEDYNDFISIEKLGLGKSVFKASCLLDTGLPSVGGITVNRVHGHADSIAKTAARLNPTVESMEGAAFFYACEQLGLPSLQVRSISNYVEPRNRDAWQMGLAVKNLNKWLVGFLENKK